MMRAPTRGLVPVLVVLATVALLMSCASTPPAPRPVNAVASLRAAETRGAGGDPIAAAYLDLAREELKAARDLRKEGIAPSCRRAEGLERRAAADADLSAAYLVDEEGGVK